MPWATWRRPAVDSGSGSAVMPPATACKGDRAARRASTRLQPRSGNADCASCACGGAIAELDEATAAGSGQAGLAVARSAANTASTWRLRGDAGPARTALPSTVPKRSRLLSRAQHPASIQGLGTVPRSVHARPGSTSRYQAGGSSIGVSRSPTPSAQALSTADEHRHVGAQRQGRAPASRPP